MSELAKRGNDALSANPNRFLYPASEYPNNSHTVSVLICSIIASDINITTHGSDWYWAVTAVMAASTFAFIGLSFRVPRTNRIFHYITGKSFNALFPLRLLTVRSHSCHHSRRLHCILHNGIKLRLRCHSSRVRALQPKGRRCLPRDLLRSIHRLVCHYTCKWHCPLRRCTS